MQSGIVIGSDPREFRDWEETDTGRGMVFGHGVMTLGGSITMEDLDNVIAAAEAKTAASGDVTSAPPRTEEPMESSVSAGIAKDQRANYKAPELPQVHRDRSALRTRNARIVQGALHLTKTTR